MSNLVQSIECMVGAGVKGLVGLAEGYLSPNAGSDGESADSAGSAEGASASAEGVVTGRDGVAPGATATAGGGKNERRESVPHPEPLSIPTTSSPTSRTHPQTHTHISKLALPKQDQLIQTVDVPSGWIHLQATYLDGDGGQRKVRSFGLRNLTAGAVEVEVESDLAGQLVFWVGDDDRSTPSSASSNSSVSTNAGTPTLSLTLPPSSTTPLFLAFQASQSQPPTPLSGTPHLEDDGFTPRVKPALSRTHSSEMSPVGLIPDGGRSEPSSLSGGSSQSVAGSTRGAPGGALVSSRKPEPIHRAFSVHGSIVIRAIAAPASPPLAAGDAPAPPTPATMSHQIVSLPFYATVCRSLFTAGPIEPSSGLVTASQQSSGDVVLDFGSENVVGKRYHRDILLVNRSEIELVWTTTVVSAPHKDAVWFELRDLDSENVFGVDHSAQPVPLPALSSRHLRLSLRSKAPVSDFEFDFIISNANQAGNVVTCRAIGAILAEVMDESLKVLSGPTLDFGQITDRMWARQMITCKNVGDRPLDVRFSATEGYDVVFRLAGVAGEDMDEDLPMERPKAIGGVGPGSGAGKGAGKVGEKEGEGLSRQSTREGRSVGRPDTPGSVTTAPTTFPSDSSNHHSMPTDAGRHPDALSERSDPSIAAHPQSQGNVERWMRERDASRPPSRSLSRVTSRTSSSHRNIRAGEGAESSSDEAEPPFFGGGGDGDRALVAGLGGLTLGSNALTATSALVEAGYTAPTVPAPAEQQVIPNQIEEVTMRPGTEYRIFVLHRPVSDPSAADSPEKAGALRKSAFKVYLDAVPASLRSPHAHHTKSRRTISCTVSSCTSLIRLASGNVIDFGEVTVGASKATTLRIENLSDLSAKVEIAAISKVLSANRNVIVIPPKETVEEKMEFFPRRINERYEKQIFVRNLLNRGNDQLVEIKSRNVDVYNLTLHSHLYRILTPSGSNFLDFGSVVINAPTVRTVHIENLSHAPLVLDLSASQPEDIELYVKAEDEPPTAKLHLLGQQRRYAEESSSGERAPPPVGEMKERFMEELSEKTANGGGKVKAKKERGKSANRAKKEEEDGEAPKMSVAASVAAALKKGGRGRPVQLYGNSVVFKDRSLLEPHEYLDLAAGPPTVAHRNSPRSKRTQLLETIELEDKSKLSGQHPRVPKLDFAASAKATGLLGKEGKEKEGKEKEGKGKKKHGHGHGHGAAGAAAKGPGTETAPGTGDHTPTTPTKPKPHLGSLALVNRLLPGGIGGPSAGLKSPALTAKRIQPILEPPTSMSPADLSKMTPDQLLLAVEQHDARRASISHSSLEEEEAYVRRTIALRKELQNLVTTGKLIPARTLAVAPGASRGLIVIMTPNPSIRPHISTRAKRADSRVFIKLVEFDRTLLNAARQATPGVGGVPITPGDGGLGMPEGAELPIRDLIIRSSCVRSVLEVQQSSINFGACDKGESKSKMIVIHNKSDCIGLFRLHTSGSIASGDLKLGLGRYGVISAFGRKQVDNFTFTPSLVGNYQETIMVENVLDSWNDQALAVKAAVRKVPAFKVDPASLEFGVVEKGGAKPAAREIVLTNVSKNERTFVVAVQSLASTSFAEVHLTRDEKDAGTALSKGEEEELEALLQKLKIARRKGKVEKVTKYETRLVELGVPRSQLGAGIEEGAESGSNDGEAEADPGAGSSKSGTPGGASPAGKGLAAITAAVLAPRQAADELDLPTECVTTLNLTLAPNQKSKILVDLIPRKLSEGEAETDVKATVMIHDRKNTDETVGVSVSASRVGKPARSKTMDTAVSSGTEEDGHDACTETSTDPAHLALMRHALQLTYHCEVSPTAFCVGSTLFLPSTSPHFAALRPHFTAFPLPPSGPPAGLILGDGFSRQIPGNTHAEANALTNFRARYGKLLGTSGDDDDDEDDAVGQQGEQGQAEGSGADGESAVAKELPPIEQVLRDAECFATMEPCSYRTSGGPSCALELVRAGVKAVYLGVEEPPDFVECEGVRILQDGGVRVTRVAGLEEECLKAARRGRS
ncbi:hypothetical protein IAT38_007875 [Cryptococcus sp. DSM 104549]